jgi:hypothetical protein
MAYFAAGLLGLVPEALRLAPPDSPQVHVTLFNGYLLGLFPVNVLHSAVHLAIGVWGILAGRSLMNPTLYARSIAVLFAALALLGLIPHLNTLFGLLPLEGHDVWLHGGTAAIAAYVGWRPAASTERRNVLPSDRRQQGAAVDLERRSGRGDRRLPGSEV